MNLKVWGILLADLITGSQIKKKKEKNEDEVWRVEPEAERWQTQYWVCSPATLLGISTDLDPPPPFTFLP